MMDWIWINNLRCQALIGVHDWERQNKQPIELDLKIGLDCSLAAQKDDIDQSVDYAHLAAVLQSFIANTEFKLIESLAQACCDKIWADFPQIEIIQLTLRKPRALNDAQSVGLIMERKRPAHP